MMFVFIFLYCFCCPKQNDNDDDEDDGSDECYFIKWSRILFTVKGQSTCKPIVA